MREVSDMERRLRATALDPGVRQEHFDALRAELQSRMRSRRRRPMLVAAASVVFMTFIVFQNQPLESFNYRLDYFVGETGNIYHYKPHEASTKTWSISTGDDNNNIIPMAKSKQEQRVRKIEITESMFDAGLLDPTKVIGTTFMGYTAHAVRYTGEAEGMKFSYLYHPGFNPHPEYNDFLKNDYLFVLTACYYGELAAYASQEYEIEDHEFILHGWRHVHPKYGEIIIWTSDIIN